MAQLALVRHGESEWNSKNLFTGWTDKLLTEKGFVEARAAAEKLRGITWNIIFESDLERVKETTDVIVKTLGLHVPVVQTEALRERSYGIYTGKNKLEIKKELGEAEYEKFHRGWDYPIPEGESLKQVYDRVVPYYLSTIEPRLKTGENVLVVASHNSLRALCKFLKGLANSEVARFEIATGEVVLMPYQAL